MSLILWSALMGGVAAALILFAAQQTDAPRSIRLIAIGAALMLAFLAITDALVASLGIDYRIPTTVLIPVSMVAYYVLVSRLVFKLSLSWRRFTRYALLALCSWAAFHLVTAGLIGLGISVAIATFVGAMGSAATNIFVQPGWAFRGETDTPVSGQHRAG